MDARTTARVPDIRHLVPHSVARMLARTLRRLAYRLDPCCRMPAERQKADEVLLSRLETLLREDKLYLDPTLSIETLASKAGTNRTYLIRALKLRNENFSTCLNGLRLEHATQLMRLYPDKDLSEIAEQSGFSNQRSLNYLIVKQYGFTLVAFRRRISQLLSGLPEGQILQPCRKVE